MPSMFTVGKSQILQNGSVLQVAMKNHSLYRVVKISKAAKRGSLADNTMKRVVFTGTRNTVCLGSFHQSFVQAL